MSAPGVRLRPTLTEHAVGREKLKGHLAMVLFAVLIAGSFILGKLATGYIAPAPLNAIRFVLASALAAGMAFGVQGHSPRLSGPLWRYAVLGGLMSIYFLTMFVALTLSSSVATSAVFTLMPLMTAGFAYLLLRQVVRPIMGLSLVFAAAGSVWVIFGGSLSAVLSFDVGEGETIFFFGCMAHALYAALLRRFNRGEPLWVSTFYILAFVTLWLLIYGANDIVHTDWTHLPAIVWVTIGYLAVFASGVTFFLIQFASLRLPASKVIAYGYLTPVFVIVIEGLTGQGWAAASVFAGALVTVMGLGVLYFARER